MCIICAKPRNVELPSKEILETMWDNNPDGAGVAMTYNGTVCINKGFMDKEKFINYLEELRYKVKNIPMLIHFRIATHGEVNKQCTHPFPIGQENQLKKTFVKTNIAVAHNGIINITTKDNMSDTMTYIKEILNNIYDAYSDFYKIEGVQRAIENSINGSRMAFIDKEGKIYKIGDWVEENGISYSNTSYKEKRNKWEHNLPKKRFSMTNAYAKENGKVYDNFPLFVDVDNKLYEYDELWSCMWEYEGEYELEKGSEKIDEFNIDIAFLDEYIDIKNKKAE